jgi:hypothetical protein
MSKLKHDLIGEDFKKLLGEMVASPNVSLEEGCVHSRSAIC